MARSSAANHGSRSQQQARRAGARDPWEEAAAALRSRDSRTPTYQWGTGTTQSTEAAITDSWGTGASREAPVMETWGPRASTETPVMETWGPRACTGAPVITFGWGAMTSTEAPVFDPWGPRASEPARDHFATERPRSTVPPPSESEVRMTITVANAKAFLHCRRLQPPTQAADLPGHAVCLACREKQFSRGTGWTCNVCRGPGFHQSGFLDNLVKSLRVPCPNAARGCDESLAYYDLDAHRVACEHAPGTPCPVRGCSFVAPIAGLLDHFGAVHGWPINDEERVGKSFHIDLHDGFNVVATAVRDGGNQQHVLLLNVGRQPFGHTISAVCIHPQLAVGGSCEAEVNKTVELELCYSAARHYQESLFSVPFVDLTDGLPDELAQFVVPKSVHPDDEASIPVTAFLTIK